MRKSKAMALFAVLLALTVAFSMLFTACGDPDDEKKPEPSVTYNVVFDVNTDGKVEHEPDRQVVESGKTAVKPSPDPARDGYVFGGWYTSAECEGEPFDFSTPITQRLTLYAKWSVAVNKYTVTFDYQGGDTNSEVTVEEGNTVEAPAAPVRDGYRFAGWFLDAAGNTAYSFSSEVKASFTLYAKWERVFTVTFDYNYAGAPAAATQEVVEGRSAQEPADPVREDYVFAGWYTDKAGSELYRFEAVTADITVYAKWTDAADPVYRITFDYNYDGAPADAVRNVPEGSPAKRRAAANTTSTIPFSRI